MTTSGSTAGTTGEARPDAPGGGPALAGRSTFRERAARAARHAGEGVPAAVFVVHLERARLIISHCGREASDAVLDLVGRRLAAHEEGWACACRLAPDRVALLREGCTLAEAVAAGKRLRHYLDEATFEWRGMSFRLDPAVGILEMEQCPSRVDDLLDRAGEACLAAERLGEDGVLVLRGRPGEQEAVARERDWREHVNEVLG